MPVVIFMLGAFPFFSPRVFLWPLFSYNNSRAIMCDRTHCRVTGSLPIMPHFPGLLWLRGRDVPPRPQSPSTHLLAKNKQTWGLDECLVHNSDVNEVCVCVCVSAHAVNHQGAAQCLVSAGPVRFSSVSFAHERGGASLRVSAGQQRAHSYTDRLTEA